MLRISVLAVLLIQILPAQSTKLLDILGEELDRNFKALKEKGDPPPYFLAYAVSEQEAGSATASQGALLASNERKSRTLDVTISVGSPKMDNYHPVRGEFAQFTRGVALSLDDSPDAIKRTLWRETDRCYRLAAERLINIKTNTDVKVAHERAIRRFLRAKVSFGRRKPAKQDFDLGDWEKRVRKLSGTYWPTVPACSIPR